MPVVRGNIYLPSPAWTLGAGRRGGEVDLRGRDSRPGPRGGHRHRQPRRARRVPAALQEVDVRPPRRHPFACTATARRRPRSPVAPHPPRGPPVPTPSRRSTRRPRRVSRAPARLRARGDPGKVMAAHLTTGARWWPRARLHRSRRGPEVRPLRPRRRCPATIDAIIAAPELGNRTGCTPTSAPRS